MKRRRDPLALALGLGATAAILVVAAVVGLSRRPRIGERRLATAEATPLERRRGHVQAVDFLPSAAVQDASVDYTAELQAAIDRAAGGVLWLPPFPVLVSARPGQRWCLRVTRPTELRGTPGSLLVERRGAVQVLRAEGVDGLRLVGFGVRGLDADGQGLAHGLVQVTGGSDVRIEDVRVRDSDADGIAVAGVRGVVVRGCTVENAAKAGIYLAHCTDGLVEGSVVRGGGGHRTPSQAVVGAGIQLSSSRRVACSDNVVAEGVGVGILCDALAGGAAPQDCAIVDNLVVDVANPANPGVSGGIRCTNGSATKTTRTSVQANRVLGCGAHGLYVENHGGSAVLGNVVLGSHGTGLVASSGSDLVVLGNVFSNSGAGSAGGDAFGLLLINQARSLTARANVVRDGTSLGPGATTAALRDASGALDHDLEARSTHGPGPPPDGLWQAGDVVHNDAPLAGAPVGWICVAGGRPGTWIALGAAE